MEKEKLTDIIKKRVFFLVGAIISILVGAGQIMLMIFEHRAYTGGVWYMLTAMWFLLAAYLIYRYIKDIRDEKEEAEKIAEFKKMYNIK